MIDHCSRCQKCCSRKSDSCSTSLEMKPKGYEAKRDHPNYWEVVFHDVVVNISFQVEGQFYLIKHP